MSSPVTSLQYTESGRGDAVILLDWTPWETPVLATALSEVYRVVDVAPPTDPGSLETLFETAQEAARAVAGIVRGLESQPCTMVGVSLGADVALQVGLMFPELVSALILVSPTCVKPSGLQDWSTTELASGAMLAHPQKEGQPTPDGHRTALLAALSGQWTSDHSDASETLPHVSSATLVVIGQEDRLVSREAGGVWKSRLPNCSISYLYDAGHAIAVDRPEALVKVVLDFAERRETFIVEKRSGLINP